jgi:hypothetical protein
MQPEESGKRHLPNSLQSREFQTMGQRTPILLIRSLLLLLLLCGSTIALAQESESKSAHAASSGAIVLPMEYVDRHLFVTLTDEKLGSLTMLVDTGWQRTTIDYTIAAKGEIGSSFWKRKISTKGFGSQAHNYKYQTVRIKLTNSADVVFSTTALVLDLRKFSQRTQHRIDGALGWDFFRSACVTLDYAAREMTVRRSSECGPLPGRHGTMKGKWSSDGVRLESVVTLENGKFAKPLLEVDTGFDNTLFLHPRFRSVLGLSAEGSSGSTQEGWGFNGTYRNDVIPFKTVELEAGKIRFDGNEGATISIGRKGGFNENSDGVIGNGLLEETVWTFDPIAKRIYLSDSRAKSKPASKLSVPAPQ